MIFNISIDTLDLRLAQQGNKKRGWLKFAI